MACVAVDIGNNTGHHSLENIKEAGSCGGLEARSNGVSLVVGSNSCKGDWACKFAGAWSGDVTIGNGSCNNLEACENVGDVGSVTRNFKVTIGENALLQRRNYTRRH
eukprot:5547923-Ditylum_brightwellii.AAC.1